MEERRATNEKLGRHIVRERVTSAGPRAVHQWRNNTVSWVTMVLFFSGSVTFLVMFRVRETSRFCEGRGVDMCEGAFGALSCDSDQRRGRWRR